MPSIVIAHIRFDWAFINICSLQIVLAVENVSGAARELFDPSLNPTQLWSLCVLRLHHPEDRSYSDAHSLSYFDHPVSLRSERMYLLLDFAIYHRPS